MQNATMAHVQIAPAGPPFVKENPMLIKDHVAVFPTATGSVSDGPQRVESFHNLQIIANRNNFQKLNDSLCRVSVRESQVIRFEGDYSLRALGSAQDGPYLSYLADCLSVRSGSPCPLHFFAHGVLKPSPSP
jgi:hypothetical protein